MRLSKSSSHLLDIDNDGNKVYIVETKTPVSPEFGEMCLLAQQEISNSPGTNIATHKTLTFYLAKIEEGDLFLSNMSRNISSNFSVYNNFQVQFMRFTISYSVSINQLHLQLPHLCYYKDEKFLDFAAQKIIEFVDDLILYCMEKRYKITILGLIDDFIEDSLLTHLDLQNVKLGFENKLRLPNRSIGFTPLNGSFLEIFKSYNF